MTLLASDLTMLRIHLLYNINFADRRR